MWSWLLTGFGVLGLYLAGKKNKLGWAVGLFAQVFWVTYAIVTKQYGFIIGSFFYGWVYAKNYLDWKRLEVA